MHIYLSSLGVGLLLFVAVTGFILNHGTRLGLDEGKTHTESIKLPAEAMSGAERVVAELRNRLGPVGAMTGYEEEAEEIRVTFKKPGARTEAVITRAGGEAEITRESRGAMGVIADLHKGADAGTWWSYVIDAAAILLGVVLITGLLLIVSMPRRRWAAMGLAVLGVTAAACVYGWMVG